MKGKHFSFSFVGRHINIITYKYNFIDMKTQSYKITYTPNLLLDNKVSSPLKILPRVLIYSDI